MFGPPWISLQTRYELPIIGVLWLEEVMAMYAQTIPRHSLGTESSPVWLISI